MWIIVSFVIINQHISKLFYHNRYCTQDWLFCIAGCIFIGRKSNIEHHKTVAEVPNADTYKIYTFIRLNTLPGVKKNDTSKETKEGRQGRDQVNQWLGQENQAQIRKGKIEKSYGLFLCMDWGGTTAWRNKDCGWQYICFSYVRPLARGTCFCGATTVPQQSLRQPFLNWQTE